MKIAFVSQPIDTILPPHQSSVGLCTYGAAACLSKSCEIVVYGARDRHKDFPAELRAQNVDFRFVSVPISDRLAVKVRKAYSDRFPLSSPASSSGWLFRGFGRQVAKDLRLQACDVIHVQHCSQYVPVIRAHNRNAKIVLHLHNRLFTQMNRAALERRVRGADLVTTVSNFVTNHIRREFPTLADRCETSYNGIDANEFVCEKDYARTRERTEKRLLFVGAVSPHSGIHVLMEAFKTIVSKYPEVHLNIVGPQTNYPLEELFDLKDRAGLASVSRFYCGSGDAARYLSHLKAQLPPEIARKVTFFGEIGVRSQLVEQYYGAEVFVFPPVCDHGFGLPPVEAMAAGTPCVVTRAGATVETVKNNETGVLVDKNDPKMLAQAIVNLLENDQMREAMGRAARRRVFEQFTWDKAALRIFDRYSSLCEMRTTADRCLIGFERKITAAGKRGGAAHNHETQFGRWSRFRPKVRGRSLSGTESIDR